MIGHWIAKALHAFAEGWCALRALGTVVNPCRFSLFVVAAGGALLLVVPQGRELLVRLPDQGPWKILIFYLSVLLWAGQSWYWARQTLDAEFGVARNPEMTSAARPQLLPGLIDHVPRTIAALSYLLAIVAGLLTWNLRVGAVALGLAPQGLLFYYLLVRRRDIATALTTRLPEWGADMLRRRRPDSTELADLAPLSRAVVYATAIMVVALTAWACRDPVGMGWGLGSAAVPFLGFAAMVPVGSLLVMAGRHGGAHRLQADRGLTVRRSYPVITLVLALAALFSLWVDNHEVRSIEQRRAEPLGGKPVEATLGTWLKQAPRRPDQSINMVVVATAGGGIRAAYWTATVLGALEDQVPDFHRQVLGISGVSGGSLGATVFATLLGQPSLPRRYASCDLDLRDPLPLSLDWRRGPYECAGQAVLSQDFLAPTEAALLFPDLIQRFLPIVFLPDRAAALEKGWERAWPAAGFAPDAWSDKAFGELWSGPRRIPDLLLNGTHVETGRRIITSNLLINPDHASDFPDAYDFAASMPAPIRPSTAAHNSARFTYVSPAGTLRSGEGGAGHIVDGGYFENFGAETAHDLLRKAQNWAAVQGVKLRPIIILISNDTGLHDEDLPAPATAASAAASSERVRPAGALRFLSEIRSPVVALGATRKAHGLAAAFDLAQLAGSEGAFFHIRLCRDPHRADPALGWVLSEASEALMREQLRTKDCKNDAQLKSLVNLLARTSDPAQNDGRE